MQKFFPVIPITFMSASLVHFMLSHEVGAVVVFVASLLLLGFLVFIEREKVSELGTLKAELAKLRVEQGQELQKQRERVDGVILSLNQGLGL